MGRIVIFDVDGTLVKGFYLERFADALYEEGLFSKTERRAIEEIFTAYRRSDDYPYQKAAMDLVRAFGRGVRGKRRGDVQRVGQIYIELHPEDKFSFTDGLIQLVRRKGYEIIVISGSPHEIILPFSRSYGINGTFATTYETEKGVFTGEVDHNCALNDEKRKIVSGHFQENDVNPDSSAGFGDSDSDLAFLELVGYPVVINPNPKLEEVARRNRWLICKEGDRIVDMVEEYLSER